MKHYLIGGLLFISVFFASAQEATIQNVSIPAE